MTPASICVCTIIQEAFFSLVLQAIRCTVPGCGCECFVPGKLQLRQCESCRHGWVAHGEYLNNPRTPLKSENIRKNAKKKKLQEIFKIKQILVEKFEFLCLFWPQASTKDKRKRWKHDFWLFHRLLFIIISPYRAPYGRVTFSKHAVIYFLSSEPCGVIWIYFHEFSHFPGGLQQRLMKFPPIKRARMMHHRDDTYMLMRAYKCISHRDMEIPAVRLYV